MWSDNAFAPTAIEEGKRFISRCRTRRIRPMGQFAAEEIVIPSGPYEGLKYRVERQPFSALWFDMVEMSWRVLVALGCVQSGKTLLCWVIPICYHLFEIGETVIAGVPKMDTAKDKWREDLLPVIKRSRYRDLLPANGGGSRGGNNFSAIEFRNGATLRFMSFGGDDKTRASFTSRVVCITETDGGDKIGTKSNETSKIGQLYARTESYGARARIYQECTVSTDKGRTWTDYKNGTASKIVRPCMYCNAWVIQEREHLLGWSTAETDSEASEKSTWCCPECGAVWTDEDRRQSNSECRILHRGQTIDDAGDIDGPIPETDILGFRWSAIDNHFWSAGDVGAKEWHALRQNDQEAGERYLRQFVYAIPIESDAEDMTKLESTAIMLRTCQLEKGIVPDDADFITVGVDVGKYLLHWLAIAWTEDAAGHIVEYGQFEVPTAAIGTERAVLIALRQLRDQIAEGWPIAADKMLKARQVWTDSGWSSPSVYAFVRESGDRFKATKGFGSNLDDGRVYSQPKGTGSKILGIGDHYHASKLPDVDLALFEVDADYWKSWLHSRLTVPIGDAHGRIIPLAEAGAITLHRGEGMIHLSLSKHFTAEKQIQEYEAGKGVRTRWERVNRNNHWLDAAALACAAGNFCGARLIGSRKKTSAPTAEPSSLRMPDGRPFLITERR